MPRDIILPIKGVTTQSDEPAPDFSYMDRLVKLVPVDLITVYISIFNIIKAATGADGGRSIPQWVFYGLMVAVAPYYLYKIAKIKAWRTIIICWISFLLWVCCFGGPFEGFIIGGASIQLWGTIVTAVFTLAIPRAAFPEFAKS
ncbi:hypothetical protein [uncultured Chitinophaga sp.]|uniref:hypothetical protein n=1 Tax=uncultured Chitinophaga sp. TaxID=339340 RepID=UPI0025E59570|nr:hypothetical protein [uncultured Chitinophaga sp.]